MFIILSRMQRQKLLRIFQVGVGLTVLVGCLPNTQLQPTKTASPVPTISSTVGTSETMTNVPTIAPTLALATQPRTTPTRAETISPSNNSVKEVIQIELGGFEHSLSEPCVLKALWSDDERLLYYASSQDCAPTPIQWAAYDVTNRITQTVAAPLNYDGHIWSRLNLNYAPELRGYRSPSGKSVIYPVERPAGAGTPAMEGKTEIWIADSSGYQKIKLLTLGINMVCSAAWLKGETRVIFDVCYEGAGQDLRIADIHTGKVVSLQDVTDFKATALDYALSPDGIPLAIVDLDGNLWLVSLEDGRARIIDRVATDLSWSEDGSRLYYRWGTALETTSAVRSYNIKTGNISTVVDETSLARANERLLHGDFTVSPSGNKIAFWNQQLWLLQLNK